LLLSLLLVDGKDYLRRLMFRADVMASGMISRFFGIAEIPISSSSSSSSTPPVLVSPATAAVTTDTTETKDTPSITSSVSSSGGSGSGHNGFVSTSSLQFTINVPVFAVNHALIAEGNTIVLAAGNWLPFVLLCDDNTLCYSVLLRAVCLSVCVCV
jgi:hypothetical protein